MVFANPPELGKLTDAFEHVYIDVARQYASDDNVFPEIQRPLK